ncbi:hypothetical protein [Polaromonas sp.]|uniref:hypothetical protein n=1 Tax=Polaromonas sp. TaxID=1869339 RepID=UPI003CAB5151
MKLKEIEQASAEEQRVKRLKDNAKQARERARQLGAQATASADQLKMQQSRQKMRQLHAPDAGATIKPHA